MPRSRSPKNPSPARHPVLTYASPDIQDLLFYIEVDSTLKPWKTPVHGEFYKDKNGEFPNHVLVHVTSADENGWVKWYYAADRENQDDYNFEIVNGEYLRRTYIIPRDEYYSRHENAITAASAYLAVGLGLGGNTITCGEEITYTIDNAPSVSVDNIINVDTGTAASVGGDALAQALEEFINGDASSQTGWTFPSRTYSTAVTAVASDLGGSGSLTVTASTAGEAGNAIAVSDTLFSGGWLEEFGGAATAFLVGGVGVLDEFTYPDAGAATPDTRFPMYCFMDDTLARGEKELDSKYVVIQRRFVRPVEINYTYNDAFKKTVKVTKEVVPLTTTAPTLGAAGTIVEIQDGNLFHSIQITQELQLEGETYPYTLTPLAATQNYRFPTRMDSVGVVYVWAYADSPDHRSSYSENWYFNFQSTEPRTGPYDATIERYITDDVSAIKTTYPLDHIPQAIRENIGVARWWLTAGPKGNATSATAKEYTVPPSIHPVIPIDTGGLAIDVGANGGDGYENDELLETAGYGDFLTLLASGAVRIDYRVRELPFNLYEVSVVSLDVTNLYSAPSP